jgi:hypothetical protein
MEGRQPWSATARLAHREPLHEDTPPEKPPLWQENFLAQVLVSCFYASMSNPASAPAEAVHPDPDRAVSAPLDTAGAGNILHLLHTLVACGRNLVQTLRQEDDPDDIPRYAFLTRIFGATDPADITVTIIRGLLRAAALQARLRPFLPLPLRAWAATQTNAGGRRPTRGPSPRRPRAAGWSIPPGWLAGDPSLDRLPTPEEEMFAEIVEEDRDRPIGPILLDICLDLGIVPSQMDRSTWDELRLALTLYGGDPAPLEARAVDSANPAGGDSPIPAADPRTADHWYRVPPMAGAVPQYPAPAGTGPP